MKPCSSHSAAPAVDGEEKGEIVCGGLGEYIAALCRERNINPD